MEDNDVFGPVCRCPGLRTSGLAGVRKSMGSRELVGPVLSLFLGLSSSSISSVSDNFLLAAGDGRVKDAFDTPFGGRNPLGTDSGSGGMGVERTCGSERASPGTSSSNKSHALRDGLGASEGSGRTGLELGTRIVPEDDGVTEK